MAESPAAGEFLVAT